MRMYDIILKKRSGAELTKEEIDYFVKGYTNGEIPDYQVSALLMAIYFQKMTKEETLNLTLAMVNSGDVLDLSAIKGIKADKHSTGGVGDKTSLVLAPMVAACGVKMAKMSGRGLGHTGGTIDKLESFKGFNTALSEEDFINNVNEIGFAITGQTGNLAPADKKLYALRDVTGTVDNLSLIASSIMSKKIAAGADVIVLDVKTGSGAFMKTVDDAVKLAECMVDIGKGAGRNTVAVVSNMDEPLGYAIGNRLEVIEAIDTLKGNGPKDLTTLCMELGKHILVAAGVTSDSVEASQILNQTLVSGAAYDKFVEFVKAQGGAVEDIENIHENIDVKEIIEVKAKTSGYIKKIRSDEIGNAAMVLGGGRETKESIIDMNVGIVLVKKVADSVKAGDVLAKVYSNDSSKTATAIERISQAYEIVNEKVEKQDLIKGVISRI